MSRLTKQQASLHAQACAYLEKEVLTFQERVFVLDHWQESAHHISSVSGAFFTPQSLARDLSIEVNGRTIIDLCAGIGSLAFACYHRDPFGKSGNLKIVCVEINPEYAAVGRKVLPEASWIVADALELPGEAEAFDCAISNPPFGRRRMPGKAPRYTGSEFEYAVIDIASEIASYGVFLLPQTSCPFRFSGRRRFEATENEKYLHFHKQTGIVLEPNCGIDTTVTLEDWHHSVPITEIAVADFSELPKERFASGRLRQGELFAAA
jgi:hypothetical protein